MKDVISKLQIKDGHVGRILNLPDMLDTKFKSWPAELLTNKSTNLDFVIVFAENKKAVEKYAANAINMLRNDGLLWFAYLKKSSKVETDISRDHGWQALSDLGYRPVRLISLDNNWSVFRFREKPKECD